MFDWYVSYEAIVDVVKEEIKDVRDGEVLILGAPNPKIAKELEKEDEILEVISFGNSMSYITEELENTN